MSVVVRPALASDLAAVEQVRLDTWRVAYRGMIPDDILDGLTVTEERVAWLEQRFAGGDVETLVATDSDTVIGMASVGACRDDDLSGLTELYALYVLPSHWDTGTGKALLMAAGDLQVLWVLEANARARAFYERHGFRPDGHSKVLDLGAGVPEVRYVLR